MSEKNLIPFNVTAEKKDKTAIFRITGHIGWGVSSEEFRRLVSQKVAEGCNSVHLYINSPGGSCFEAEEL